MRRTGREGDVPSAGAGGGRAGLGPAAGAAGRRRLAAVLFDVDFTLARPGPELGPEGYRRAGERLGLTLDPARYEGARLAALEALQRHPELAHDDEVWVAFTARIVAGMGGTGEAVRRLAEEITRAWEVHDNFELYEDVHPVLAELRRHGLKLALVSNTARNLEEFVSHHALDVDATISSGAHGRVKPHRSIFEAVLARLEVEPPAAAMVGDSPADDIEGARALGMQAFLVDRDGRLDDPSALPDLLALPAALGLPRPA
jgi:HAD superfamily hydrolase (TIGR01662 family)